MSRSVARVPDRISEDRSASGLVLASSSSAEQPRYDDRELFNVVFTKMRRLAGPHPDFDDLVQKALIEVYGALPRFREEAKLSTFIAAICYRTWLKHLRWSMRWLKRFRLTREGELPEQVDGSAIPSETVLERERWLRLYQGLNQVTEKRRAVVILHDLEGLELEEIAEIVAAPLGTVRTRLRDGRTALRKILERDPYFFPPEEP